VTVSNPIRGKLALVATALFIAFSAPMQAADVAANPAPQRGWYAVLGNGFSVRHLRREEMGLNTRLWLDSNSGYVDVPTSQIVRYEQEEVAPPSVTPPPAVASAASPPSVTELISAAGNKHQIDPDFVASVIRAESGFNPRAVSPKGARGLMQLMPQTAAKLGVQNSFDPGANIDGGTRYLRGLLEQYNGDAVRALAAYNAGPQRVTQYGGVPPYHETRAYVARVIRDFNQKKIAADPSLAKSKSSAHSLHRGAQQSATAAAGNPSTGQ
jgi:soluble lytic murein transglycosylase-like protein